MNKRSFLSICCVILLSCADRRSYDLMPYPNERTPLRGLFVLSGAAFACVMGTDAMLCAAVEAFMTRLAGIFRFTSVVYADDPVIGAGFLFVADLMLGPGEYSLEGGRRRVEVRAESHAGFLCTVQTPERRRPAEVFRNESLDVSVDRGEWTASDFGRLVCRAETGMWIFPPVRCSVNLSDDNASFGQAGTSENSTSGFSGPEGRYTGIFLRTATRCQRVASEPLYTMSGWRDGAGQRAYLFSAEIVVR